MRNDLRKATIAALAAAALAVSDGRTADADTRLDEATTGLMRLSGQGEDVATLVDRLERLDERLTRA